jgi:hypothetical protein
MTLVLMKFGPPEFRKHPLVLALLEMLGIKSRGHAIQKKRNIVC